MFNLKEKKSGFTLVELIVVIAVITIITGTAGVSLSNFLTRSQLDSYTNQVVHTLRKAQNNAFVSLYDTNWGVYFEQNSSENDRFVFFQGDSFEGSQRQENYDLPKNLKFKNISREEIIFQKSTGEIATVANLEVVDIEGKNYQLEINELGKIEIK